jgi:phage shock protein E
MLNKRLLWLVLPLVALLGWLSMAGSASHTRISGTEAQELVSSGARLVDVRTPSEYQTKHLPGAVNLPLQQLEERMKELEPKDGAIVLYCRSGHRSGIVYEALRKQGFAKVYDLGPMTAW